MEVIYAHPWWTTLWITLIVMGISTIGSKGD